MISSPFDDDLVDRARAGDPLAAPMLVSLLGDRLLGFAHSQAPQLSDADREQIVELAIEAGVRAIHQYDPSRGTLFSWFRQQVRYQTRQWTRTHPTVGSQLDDVEQVIVCESSWMDDSVIRTGLAAAVAELGAKDRLILALHLAEGLTFSEIGLRLDISEDAARQRHKRALDRLRKIANKNEALTARFTRPKEGTTA